MNNKERLLVYFTGVSITSYFFIPHSDNRHSNLSKNLYILILSDSVNKMTDILH